MRNSQIYSKRFPKRLILTDDESALIISSFFNMLIKLIKELLHP